MVSAGSELSDQDQPSSQTDPTPEPPPSAEGASSSPCPASSTDHRAEVTEGGAQGAEHQQETREDESLTSLLNEIVFLNQQTVTAATAEEMLLPGQPFSEDTVVGGDMEQGHAHSPWLLELDSDSDDATETEKAGLNDYTDMTPSGLQPGPADVNAKVGVLAPPPLLQMKVGGAKVADPASSDGAEGGGRREDGVAWRPMPRLVPLGLKGNPPS